MVNHQTIKRLISFVHHLEEKLSSVTNIHEKLQELVTVVSKTHEIIVEELSNVKTVLNEITIEIEEEDKRNSIIPNNGIKCEWDNQQDRENQIKKSNENIRRKLSPSIDQNKDFRLNSISSISDNHSNVKKSDQLTRNRLSKSVSFSVDKNILHQRLIKETKNETTDEIPMPVLPSSSSLSSSSSSSDPLKHNLSEVTQTTGKVLTNIRIHEIEPKNGDYLRLLNLSNSDDYDLSGHFLQQNTVSKPLCRFRFPPNTIIQAGQTITIWCGNAKDITPQPPHVFVWKEQRKWETGFECLTILSKPNGQSIGWFRNTIPDNIDRSSSDIVFVRSKSSSASPESSSILKNSSRLSTRPSRLSAFHSFSNQKFPSTYSPNNMVHPDHNGTSNDLRSQLDQRVGLSYLFPRSKSSSFTGRTNEKQTILKT